MTWAVAGQIGAAALVGGGTLLSNYLQGQNANSLNEMYMAMFEKNLALEEKQFALQQGQSEEAYELNHGYVIPRNNLMDQLNEMEKAPYIEAGHKYLQELQNLTSGKTDISQTPGYKYGLNAVQQGQAAQRGLLSGRGMKEMADYGNKFYRGQVQDLYALSRPTAIQQRQLMGLMAGGASEENSGDCGTDFYTVKIHGGNPETSNPATDEALARGVKDLEACEPKSDSVDYGAPKKDIGKYGGQDKGSCPPGTQMVNGICYNPNKGL